LKKGNALYCSLYLVILQASGNNWAFHFSPLVFGQFLGFWDLALLLNCLRALNFYAKILPRLLKGLWSLVKVALKVKLQGNLVIFF
jgi:hypothetical protein